MDGLVGRLLARLAAAGGGGGRAPPPLGLYALILRC
jgi:hypothetical protein